MQVCINPQTDKLFITLDHPISAAPSDMDHLDPGPEEQRRTPVMAGWPIPSAIQLQN